MLRYISFCGADDSVEPELLSIISQNFPMVEWGFLFRPDSEGQPRYPTENWINKLVDVNSKAKHPMNLAAHLCGSRCEEVLNGDTRFLNKLGSLGFRRFQINATIANNVIVDISTDAENLTQNIKSCMNLFPNLEFIMQCNDETKPLCDILMSDPPTNMSVLFDASCGQGIPISNDCNQLPLPHSVVPCGYAGGLGPHNLRSILPVIFQKIQSNMPIWIDMESSLREYVASNKMSARNCEFQDVFSLRACYRCIQIVQQVIQK